MDYESIVEIAGTVLFTIVVLALIWAASHNRGDRH